MHKYRLEFVIESPVPIKENLEKIIEAICSLLATAGVIAFGLFYEEE